MAFRKAKDDDELEANRSAFDAAEKQRGIFLGNLGKKKPAQAAGSAEAPAAAATPAVTALPAELSTPEGKAAVDWLQRMKKDQRNVGASDEEIFRFGQANGRVPKTWKWSTPGAERGLNTGGATASY